MLGVSAAVFLLSPSCGKEVPLEECADVSLSCDRTSGSTILDYPGKRITIPFRMTEVGRGNIRASVSVEGDVISSCSFDPETREGRLQIKLPTGNDLHGSVVLSVTDGETTASLSFKTKTYGFSVEAAPIVFSGENGESMPLGYTLTTDIPDCEVQLSPAEGAFFKVEGDRLVVLEENRSGETRASFCLVTESSGVMGSFRVEVLQESLPIPQVTGCVAFKDAALKKALVALADADGDGEVSPEEALAVKEIDIAGLGVRELSGIGAFKNAWKLDARDNDIRDGGEIARMRMLHWLDLKGNRNLETFDVTGCTLYFEHCEFEVTEDLVYYTTRQQIQVTNVSDRKCRHSRHVEDTRKTVDWSDQDGLVLLRGHKKGRGYPVFFSGLSYLDEDMRDGSFMRLMRDCLKYLLQYDAILEEYSPYIDFYAVKHKAVDRNQYFVSREHCELGDPFMEAQVTKVNRDHAALFEKMYGVLADNPAEVNRVFPKFIEVNPLGHPGRFTGFNYDVGVLSDKGWITVQFLHTSMDDEDERWFGGSWSQGVEENCRIHAESNNNEKVFPTYRDFFEENVVN